MLFIRQSVYCTVLYTGWAALISCCSHFNKHWIYVVRSMDDIQPRHHEVQSTEVIMLCCGHIWLCTNIILHILYICRRLFISVFITIHNCPHLEHHQTSSNDYCLMLPFPVTQFSPILRNFELEGSASNNHYWHSRAVNNEMLTVSMWWLIAQCQGIIFCVQVYECILKLFSDSEEKTLFSWFRLTIILYIMELSVSVSGRRSVFLEPFRILGKFRILWSV